MQTDEEPIGYELLEAGLPAFGTIYADPPWRYGSPSGRFSPSSRTRFHYETVAVDQIAAMPVGQLARRNAHLYLWVVNGLLDAGLEVMRRWGFTYKTNLVWAKVRADGGMDRSGVGNYFRHAAEILLFGVRGSLPTRRPARSQASVVLARRREHSRKPDEFWPLVQRCSPGPYLELFARYPKQGWYQWGNEMNKRLWTSAKRHTTLARTYRDRFVVFRPRAKGKAVR